MKKVLITGSLGLVGSACVEFFKKQGWEVIGIDNNSRARFFGTPLKEDGETLEVDVTGPLGLLFTKKGPFDAIIHTAGQPSHDYASDHVIEDFYVNALGTLNLLETTRTLAPEAVFVYVSTDKVYGENMMRKLKEGKTRYTSDKPYDESLGLDFAGRRSLFGCSKAAADMYVQEYGNYFGMKTVCFRPGCITGKAHEGAEQHGFLAYVAKCVKEQKPYKIFGYKGKQVRDQIHAMDLASAFLAFIENPKVGAVYNIGGGEDRSLSVLEAFDACAKEMDKPVPPLEFHEERKGDRQWDVHDVSKFRTDYPEWDYKFSLADIFEDVCKK